MATFGQNDLTQSDILAGRRTPPVSGSPQSQATFGHNDRRMGEPERAAEDSGDSDRIEFNDLPNIDELKTPFFDAASWKASLGMLAAIDNTQKMEVLKKAFPDATFSADKFNNPILEAYGQRVYISKPGFRLQDVIQGAGQAVATMGGMGAIRLVPKLRNVAQAIRGGIAGAGVLAGSDLVAHGLGAEKFIDAPRAAIGGIVSAGSEAVLTPLMGAIASRISKAVPSHRVIDKAGAYTPEALDSLDAIGMKPADLSAAFREHFMKLARGAVSVEDSAKLAQAQSLPIPVPQTRGTLSGRGSDQMLESSAAAGALGSEAESVMTATIRAQQDALRGNVGAIRQQIGAGIERNVGGVIAQEKLAGALARTKRAVGAAYDVSRKNPAWVAGDELVSFADNVTGSIKDFSKLAAPVANEKVDELAKLAAGDALSTAELFDWRRSASTVANKAPTLTEGAALKKAIRAFDEGISDTITAALQSGHPDAVKFAARAIALRRGQGVRFQGGDLIEDLLEKEGRRFKVAPEAVANVIFGASDTGLIPRPQLARDLIRLRGRLGKESAAWKGLKEEAFIRFASAGEGAMQAGDRVFSGGNFKKAWGNAWEKNRETMQVIFSPAERRLISNFADVAARTTGKVPGGANPAGTAAALSAMAQQIVDMLGPVAGALLRATGKAAGKASKSQQAITAATKPLALKTIKPGIGAALGTTYSGQTAKE